MPNPNSDGYNDIDPTHTILEGDSLMPAKKPTKDDYAKAIIAEGQKRCISPRGIQIALATALVESNLTMYANESDPDSLNFPHQALSTDANSSGLFQQRGAMIKT